MLIHPQLDPIALQLGPLKLHWYGLMYLFAFLSFIQLGKKQLKKPGGAILMKIFLMTPFSMVL